MPAESDLLGGGDRWAVEQYGLAVQARGGRVELPIGTGNFEGGKLSPITRCQTDAEGEMDAKSVSLAGNGSGQWTGVDQVVTTVGVRQRPQRQSLADFLLFDRVDILDVADVGGHGHAGIRQGQHAALCFPDLGQ